MLIEERRCREEENRVREAELREECQRREEDLAKHEEESRKQMLLLQALIEGVKKQGEVAVRKAESDKDVKVAKLTENDDIEAYLTTFEQLMVAYEVKKDKWTFKLAPQLVGKAQQACEILDFGQHLSVCVRARQLNSYLVSRGFKTIN